MLAQHPCMVVLACDNPECPNRGRLAVGRNEEWERQIGKDASTEASFQAEYDFLK
jgi:hypothetical protein